MTVDDQRRPERVRFVVLAAYRRFPGCCMEPIEDARRLTALLKETDAHR